MSAAVLTNIHTAQRTHQVMNMAPQTHLQHKHAAARASAAWEPRRPSHRRRQAAPLRVYAQSQQQEQIQQEGEGLPESPDADGLLLDDLKLPKFMPFTPRNAVQHAMTSFRSWHPCEDGQTLLVLPLTPEWVADTADLLTDSFAESMSASQFKNYLRRQVKAYLEAHMMLPPKAVVLVALLLPPPPEVAPLPGQADADGETQQQEQQGSSSGATEDAAAIQQQQQQQEPQGAVTAADPSAAQQQGQEQEGGWEFGDGMAIHPLLSSLGSDASSSSSSSSDGEVDQEKPGSGAVLTGVVELSFSASTRSAYFTLKPPEDRCYLCNMATHRDYRGRGYGLKVLQAAEELVALLGEREIFLHLRVQDEPAARLYQKAGYQEVAADTFFVRFLGLDQRRLLRKVLNK